MIKIDNPEQRARARLRAALRCIRLLRRATTRVRIGVTTVDPYDGHYDGPDSDARQSCTGCGMYSATHSNLHEPGCLVVEARRALAAFDALGRTPARKRTR